MKLGEDMIKFMSLYYVFINFDETLETRDGKEQAKLTDEKIKQINTLIGDLEETASEIQKQVTRNSGSKIDDSQDVADFYDKFDEYKFRSFGFTARTKKSDEKKPGDDSPSGDTGKKKKPPESPAQGDLQREKEPSKRKQAARRAQQRGQLEETLISKLKPLIKEILKKGK